MRAALIPEEPPPSTTTLPGNTPGTPPNNSDLNPLQVHLQDGHIRPHALSHARCVDTGRAAAQHDDLARQHARHAAQQYRSESAPSPPPGWSHPPPCPEPCALR